MTVAFGSLISVMLPQMHQALSTQFGLQKTMQLLAIAFIPALLMALSIPKKQESDVSH